MRISYWSSDVFSSDLIGFAGRAQADIVGEEGGADDVVVAVDGVRAPDDRDFRAFVRARHGGVIIFVGQLEPFGGGGIFVAIGAAIAAVQDRADRGDRKSVVEGKSVSVRVDLGGRRFMKKKKKIIQVRKTIK